MAKTLTLPTGANVSAEQYHQWLEQYEEADKAVAEAVSERRDLRKKIKAASVPLAAFDRSRTDAKIAAATREHEELWYQTMMAWQGKPVPVGGQSAFDLDDESQAAVYQRRLMVAEEEGHRAGTAGRNVDTCSWPSGSEGAQRWHTGWHAGQRENAEKLGSAGKSNGHANGQADPEATPRRRGRPPGSRNRSRGAGDGEPAGDKL